jgi:hypothetical protein
MKLKILLTLGGLLSLTVVYFALCLFIPTVCFKYGALEFQYRHHLRNNPLISVDYSRYLDEEEPLFYHPGDPIVWGIEYALENHLSVNRYDMHAILAGGVATLVDIGDKRNTERAEILLRERRGKGGGVDLDEAIQDALTEISTRPRPTPAAPSIAP